MRFPLRFAAAAEDRASRAPALRIAGIIFLGALALHLWFVSTGWHHGLLEFHSFRQIQTSLLVQEFIAHGVDFRSPFPLFGPPWFLPFEFPIYQATAALIAKLFSLPATEAGRLASLLFFYAGLPAIWRIGRALGHDTPLRLLTLALMLLGPVHVYYGRSVMIESCAWALSWWFLAGFTAGLNPKPSGANRWLAVAIAAGIAAALAKITTLAAFLGAAGLFTLWQLGRELNRGATESRRQGVVLIARSLAMAVPPLVVAMVWIRYSDELKAQNPFSAVFVSENIRAFTLGSGELRLSGDFWTGIWRHAAQVGLAPVNFILLAATGLIWTDRRRCLVAGLVAAFLCGPLIFANLYHVHDYYYFATAAFLLLALAVAWGRLLEWAVIPLWIRYALVILSLGAQVQRYASIYRPGQLEQQEVWPRGLGDIVAASSRPADNVLAFGFEWTPLFPYFASRPSIMVMDQKFNETAEIDAVLSRLQNPVTVIAVTGQIRAYPAFIKPYLDRFDMPARPLAENDTISIFVSRSRIAEAVVAWPELDHGSFRLATAPVAPDADARKAVALATAERPELADFSPWPETLIHPAGLLWIDFNGKPCMSAHASADLIFPLPTGAHEVQVDFGIFPDAYKDAAGATDGVEFLVELLPASGGEPWQLDAELLDPMHDAKARGPQTRVISLPQGVSGKLRLRTLPGLNGNASFDWSYWSAVKIR